VLSEVMEHYGLASPLDEAGFFETEHHRTVVRQVKAAVQAGRLVALSGLVGAGKTVLVRQLQDELAREGKVLVARSGQSSERVFTRPGGLGSRGRRCSSRRACAGS